MKVREIIREAGITEQTFYRWKSKYGGLSVSEARRLKELEAENTKLKRLLETRRSFRYWDFVHDRTENGRNLRVLNVVDDYTRELIACIPEHSFSGFRVVRELDRIMEMKDIKPRSMTMDNGPEFTSRAFMSWAYDKKIRINYIEPGKPTQNAYVESFNGKFRDECLNLNWFKDLKEARRIIEAWKDDYNHHRPHSALNQMTPMEYKKQFILTHQTV